MADRSVYPVRIVTPEGTAFEGDVELLTVTGTGGDAGFYARHAPLVAQLRMGTVKATLEDGTERTWATRGGYASVHDSIGLVVVDDAADLEQLDAASAQAELETAKADLEKAQSASTEGDVFTAGVERAEAAVAWGEHLVALAGA